MRRERNAQLTKKIIQKTMLNLLLKKTPDRITVTELCEKADINRGTFYRYYSDIFDLFDKLEKEMVGTERAAGNWDSILDLIYYNNVFYKVFLVKEYHSEYLETIIRNIQDNLLKIQIESRKPFDRSHLDYALEYARWGVIGLIKKWVDHDCPESPDVIADIIRGLSGMLE